jgi:hypothetical protein
MIALLLLPANEFATFGWLPARPGVARTPKVRSNRLWHEALAVRLHWLRHGIVLPLCEPTD